jgi:hypothetical protein
MQILPRILSMAQAVLLIAFVTATADCVPPDGCEQTATCPPDPAFDASSASADAHADVWAVGDISVEDRPAEPDGNQSGPSSDAGTIDSSAIDAGSEARACGDCPGPTAGPGTPYCDQGSCKIQCSTGFTLCGAVCADLQNDGMNCNECGQKCSTGMACQGGTC